MSWISPLKKNHCIQVDHSSPKPSCRRLNFDVVDEITVTEKKELDLTTLGELYKFNFLTTDKPLKKPLLFFDIREQVLEIEKCLQKCSLNQGEIEFVREKVHAHLLLDEDHYEEKMSELGLILFYLDRDGKLPNDLRPLMTYRAAQICTEVNEYLDTHTKICSNPRIPSGKTHYIMRALVHMILTDEHVYNRGGLIAIKRLLQQLEHPISQHIQPEHREHIIRVVNEILSHAAFNTRFKQPIAVDKSMEKLIRIDLKLSLDQEVTSVNAYHACLMALLVDIRQLENPNCYAISSLIYAIESHTYKVFTNMIQWLEKGVYQFDAETHIPLYPILEKRLRYSNELHFELESSQAPELTPVKHLSDVLSVKPKTPEKGTKQLKHIFSKLYANESTNEALFAEELYYAYKSNALTHMLLAVFEFAYMNQKAAKGLPCLYSKDKEEFIQASLAALQKTVPLSKKNGDFYNKVGLKLGKKLWLQNHGENNVHKEYSCIKVDGAPVIQSFKGDADSMVQLFKKALRVFVYESGTYTLLTTLSSLHKVISDTIEEVDQEFPQTKYAVNSIYNQLVKALKNFKKEFSGYMEKQIHANSHGDIKGINAKQLNWADILILRQTGGYEEIVLKQIFDLSLTQEVISDSDKPKLFLKNLVEKVNKLDKVLLQKTPKLLLCGGRHAWAISPAYWNILQNAQEDFDSFLNETFFTPAIKKLSAKPKRKIVNKIIASYANNDMQKIASLNQSIIDNKPLNYGDLFQVLLDKVGSSGESFIMQAIQDEFSKITLSEDEFLSLLNQLPLDVTPERKQLYNLLPNEPMLPHHLANEMRTLLIKDKIFEPFALEQELCKLKKMPLSIYLGDRNYLDCFREDPSHVHMVIGFNWASNSLCYFEREACQQKMMNANQMTKFTIKYPSKL